MSNGPESQNEAFIIPKSLLRRTGLIIATLVSLLLIILAVTLVARAVSQTDSLENAINGNEYQAVFLANGQVYFGNLTYPGGDFYDLRHVYYLQSQKSPQGGSTVHQSLVKLGNEIHGPEDLMVINRNQILFVENLKPSGQVSRAITAAHGH